MKCLPELGSAKFKAMTKEQESSPPLLPFYTTLPYTLALRVPNGFSKIVHIGKFLQRSGHYRAAAAQQCSSVQAFVVISTGDIDWVRTTGTSYFL
ncbi:hypothetical protein DPMN_135991 [Dreissena polymorpha]|uniref:Uncharacterized protein n=1 Tax=Dreissena polymorpha TaxID=45954 RepID=A0A9D4G2T9_DREPO|nr:hypothetical protein DPMN_135991 [Dreissena polymorpha]